jgi:hypothetical protein
MPKKISKRRTLVNSSNNSFMESPRDAYKAMLSSVRGSKIDSPKKLTGRTRGISFNDKSEEKSEDRRMARQKKRAHGS